jgi:hypothetical protein
MTALYVILLWLAVGLFAALVVGRAASLGGERNHRR